jgi:colanic acid/amylovoran biosynthesis protein WcaK/AmsJ
MQERMIEQAGSPMRPMASDPVVTSHEEAVALRLVLGGAAPDTSNMGVSALCYSASAAILQRLQSAQLTVLDFGRGLRRDAYQFDDQRISFERVGARFSKRLYQSESMWRISASARFGGLGNVAAQHILRADAILDISGGDSFADLYGSRRLRSVAWLKQLAISLGRPLVLLPQTFGPFRGTDSQVLASRIVQGAAMCWARDKRSFSILQQLLGDQFNPMRHRRGVDVAFLLPTSPPNAALQSLVDEWPNIGENTPLVGFNVSGLIYNDPGAPQQYSIVADYREVVIQFIRRLLRDTQANILMVPHVLAPKGHFESDLEASEDVFEALKEEAKGRLKIVPNRFDQSELKWIIAQCEWYCGTRMHSTIAGLSSGVPTAAIAYSDKTLGVFETCGQGHHVADPRHLDTKIMVEHLWKSWAGRKQTEEHLARHLPGVLTQAEAQMDAIADFCVSCASTSNARPD